MRRLFLTAEEIATIEGRHVKYVQTDLRAGLYRGASGGGGSPWRVLAEQYERQYGMTPGTLRAESREADLTTAEELAALAVRFWQGVEKAGSEDCWPWMGGEPDADGYGRFCVGGKKYGAHRIAANLALGLPLERSVMVLHECDNPICCNPRHLRGGSHRENMSDRSARGRAAKGPRNGRAAITEAQALQIVGLIRGGQGYTDIARLLGVSFSTVREIGRGKTWKHLA